MCLTVRRMVWVDKQSPRSGGEMQILQNSNQTPLTVHNHNFVTVHFWHECIVNTKLPVHGFTVTVTMAVKEEEDLIAKQFCEVN